MASRSDVRNLLKELDRAGVKYELTRGNHWKAYAPNGVVFFPSTPSDGRAMLNARADLRRNGVKV